MTRKWLSMAASFRAPVQSAAPRPLEGQEALQRRRERLGASRDAARRAPLAPPVQPLDAQLLADGEALEAAWQAELRAMIAARRGGAEALVTARAVRGECEAIVGRIEAAHALTLDGLKVKARAQSWRSDGKSVAPAADDQQDDGVWTEMAELPRYDSPAARNATAVYA
jgi:hypothetical protein